jgi:DNA-binding LacI/PurR family transcriptional regulator
MLIGKYLELISPIEKSSERWMYKMSKNSNMSSIKLIASELKLSIGTVSIVLNGRGDEMRISQATQKRIYDYAKDINYRPNVYAKRLRKAQKNRNAPIIAVFWPATSNSALISRFFVGVQSFRDTDKRNVEIMLQPYRYNEISEESDYISSSYYSGAIFMGLSELDVSFVLRNTFDIPIVLFNRPSDKYSSVCVDDLDTGIKAADLLYRRGHSKLALISYGTASRPSLMKRSGFLSACRERGLVIEKNHIIDGDMSYEGGNHAVIKLLDACGNDLPTAVFMEESVMAVGALQAFKARGIEIPRDMEVLSYGDNQQDAYMIPSLTSIRMPVEEMSYDCLRILFELLDGYSKKNITAMHSTSFVFRESCGDFTSRFRE